MLTLLMVLAFGANALAQGGLPPDIVRSPSLTASQLDQITQFVRQHQDALISEDPIACQRARKRLADPLEASNISLAFRRAYSDLLVASVSIGAGKRNEHVAVNALLLAGRLATPEAVDTLEEALDADRVAVRYAGVAGMTILMAQIDQSAAAVPDARVLEVVYRLSELVENEENPIVFDAGVRALVAAGQQTKYAGVRAASYTALADSVGARLKQHIGPLESQTLAGVLRAADSLRSVLITDIRNEQSAVARKAAELSGHVLALLAERADSGDFDGWEDDAEIAALRSGAIQTLQLCEQAINLVNGDYLGGRPIAPLNLSDMLSEDRTDDLVNAIENDVIGPTGILIRQPFGFTAGSFDR